jgi:ubiquinone/menaquinone biosynthesis C-methylase UbiE
MNEEIKNYYDDLAYSYDSNRFENSYGKFIDKQERIFLTKHLPSVSTHNILDLGCGTGRFLEFANNGVDISPKMIEVASKKHPLKELKEGSVTSIPFPNNYFDTIYSLHVIMHLNKETTASFLTEAASKTQAKGSLIFDFPSKKRRSLVKYKANNWHAANQFSIEEITELAENHWIVKQSAGILFLPIHRFPSFIRPLLSKIDHLLCRSFLKEYASYIIIKLEKK